MTLTDPDDPIEDRLVALAREILDLTDPEARGGALAVDRHAENAATLTFVVGQRTDAARTVTTTEIDFDPKVRRFRVKWAERALQEAADDLAGSVASIDTADTWYGLTYRPPSTETLYAALDALRFVLGNDDIDKDPEPEKGLGTLVNESQIAHVLNLGSWVVPGLRHRNLFPEPDFPDHDGSKDNDLWKWSTIEAWAAHRDVPKSGSPKRGTLQIPEVVVVDAHGRRTRKRGLDVHRISRRLGAYP